MNLNKSICLSELLRRQMPHTGNYLLQSYLFYFWTASLLLLLLPVTPEVSHGSSSSSSAATLQQKVCASLTRLCHRYALKCQLSHTEKDWRRGPCENGSNVSTGNLPRMIRKLLLPSSSQSNKCNLRAFHCFIVSYSNRLIKLDSLKFRSKHSWLRVSYNHKLFSFFFSLLQW